MQIDAKKLFDLIAEVHEQFQREVNQSVPKNDNAQGIRALGGMGALERLERALRLRLGLFERAEDLEGENVQRIEELPTRRPMRTVSRKV